MSMLYNSTFSEEDMGMDFEIVKSFSTPELIMMHRSRSVDKVVEMHIWSLNRDM